MVTKHFCIATLLERTMVSSIDHDNFWTKKKFKKLNNLLEVPYLYTCTLKKAKSLEILILTQKKLNINYKTTKNLLFVEMNLLQSW